MRAQSTWFSARWVEKNENRVLRIQSRDTRKSIQGEDLMVKKKSSITLSQACEGMLLNKQAEGRSVHTINDYRNTFHKLPCFLVQIQ